MKRPIVVIISLITLIVLLSFIQVVVSNRFSTTGLTLGEVEDRIAQYQKENAILTEKLLFASSYTHIASEAAQLGFVDSRNTVYITTPIPIAFRP